MNRIKVLLVFGTRPEAIKMAPLVKAMEKNPYLKTVVAVSAQHRQMLDQAMRSFAIKPHYDLNIMRDGQTLAEITSKVLCGMERIFAVEEPRLVLVHGDTTTAFAAGLAAFYHRIPLGHVEAGLRTYNKLSPFPEEINRRMISCLAEIHFAPTVAAKKSLIAEGIPGARIVVTGNTIMDILLQNLKKNRFFQQKDLRDIDFNRKKIILFTFHHRENLGAPMRKIFFALRRFIESDENLEMVFPVHPNPKIRKEVRELLGGSARIHLIEPLDYDLFIYLIHRSRLVITDSGGIQEEAPALGKPVLLLRDATERVEGVTAGTVKLIGTDAEKLVRELKTVLYNTEEYNRMSKIINLYGDGHASRRIVHSILHYFGVLSEPAPEYQSPNERNSSRLL